MGSGEDDGGGDDVDGGGGDDDDECGCGGKGTRGVFDVDGT